MLVGLLLVLMSGFLDSGLALAVVGLVVVGLGLALFGTSFWVSRTQSVHVVLDDDGYQIHGPEGTESRRWLDVARVTRGDDRITMYHKDGARVQLIVTRDGTADLDALGADIARRLDADRGYGAGGPLDA